MKNVYGLILFHKSSDVLVTHRKSEKKYWWLVISDLHLHKKECAGVELTVSMFVS